MSQRVKLANLNPVALGSRHCGDRCCGMSLEVDMVRVRELEKSWPSMWSVQACLERNKRNAEVCVFSKGSLKRVLEG
jgi:hypothetical protein